MNASNELRIFISSTFRDLQAEREHLMKKVFPEIRSICRERGITFTEIDLRWGLTEEQATLGTVIRTCLEEIDKCRPYFLGLLGSRYGWIPELHEVLIDPELLTKYPWIEEAAMAGTSMTEMEFIHGVFAASATVDDYAFFYHRIGDVDDVHHAERFGSLVERVRSTGLPFRDFETIDQLGEQVTADLKRMVDRYWPVAEALSPLQLERRAHAAYAASRRRAYIPSPEYLSAFDAWLAAETSTAGSVPLVISGKSGLGKSSLMSYLVDQYRKKNGNALVIEHYVGASPASGSARAIMQQIIGEIRDRFAIDEEPSSESESLEESLPSWLFRCAQLARDADIPVLIAIDAVNQLDEQGGELAWMPTTIPKGVRLIVSTATEAIATTLAARGWASLVVEPLRDERVRQSIVVRYLGEFHKGISPEPLRRLTCDIKAESPLYLRVVAEELRLHGEHESLDDAIERYHTAADLDEVFQRVLERLENDYGRAPLERLLTLLLVSRAGLNETELLEITGTSRLDLSRLLFALDYHLIRRDGLLAFFHDYLHRAVEARYITGEEKRIEIHRELADYFDAQNASPRTSRELFWQLHGTGDRERLADTLATIEHFMAAYQGEGQYEVQRYWAEIADDCDIEAAYRAGLERCTFADGREQAAALGRVSELLMVAGKWDSVLALRQERLRLVVDSGDWQEEWRAHQSLGSLLLDRGEYDLAQQHFLRARDIAADAGDEWALADATANMGKVHTMRHQYDRALACFRQAESVCRALGDHANLMKAIYNIGNVHWQREEYDTALTYYEQVEEDYRKRGNYSGLWRVIGAQGSAYMRRNEHEKALKYFREQERICSELGDRDGMAWALSNLGSIYRHQRSNDAALECFLQVEAIGRELESPRHMTVAEANIGSIHFDRGETDEALHCFERMLEVCRQKDETSGMAFALSQIGMIHARHDDGERALEHLFRAERLYRTIAAPYDLSSLLERLSRLLISYATLQPSPSWLERCVRVPDRSRLAEAALDAALERVDEGLRMEKEFSIPDPTYTFRMLRARILAARGEVDQAIVELRRVIDLADDIGRAEAFYWLSKLDGSNADDHHREALNLYRTIHAKTRSHEYKLRVEELTMARPR